MSSTKTLLEWRKRLKAKKPDFIRQDAHKRPALGRKWRRPKGIQSKMRKHLHGYRRSVSTGYSSPRAVHGLHPSGMQPVLIHTIKDLKSIDSKIQGVVLAHVGMKRKTELLQYAIEKKITVLNIKDPAAYLKQVQQDRQKQKEEQSTKQKEKQQKSGESRKPEEKAKESVQKEEGALPEDEKKKEQLKEMEKVLTKKQ